MPATEPSPRVGDTVLFVVPGGLAMGEDRPAIVTAVLRDARDHRVNVQWFTDCDRDGAAGPRWAASVPYDANGRPGTWRPRPAT